MKQIKTIFIGTSDFGIPSLSYLIKDDLYDVIAVVTQPDRPVGRKQKLQAPPVKEWVLQHAPKLDIVQPEKIASVSRSLLSTYNPDLVVVAAYGQIIPRDMLSVPRFGALNIHGSLLPLLRGAVPVQIAILEGYKKTGVTLQKMVYEMDAGDILAQKSIAIAPDDTTGSLMQTLAHLSSEMLQESLPLWVVGKITQEVQDHVQATFCYQKDIRKGRAEITAETPVIKAERMVRAFFPWPIAWLFIPNGKYKGKRLRIFAAHISFTTQNTQDPGELFITSQGSLAFACIDGVLVLEEVQLEGKDRRSGEEYSIILDM